MKRKKSKYWTRKYDPLYTWNRGGRLKEIRKRNLARKFFLHWKTKVWGGNLMRVVTPEKADKFRKRSLLKKVRKSQKILKNFLKAFIAYKTIWWENNKEWKLDLKAKVCHEKYLQQQALEYWKDFLAYRKYLKILEQRSREFHDHNLRKKFVGKIVIGAYSSRQTKELQYQANRYKELSCVRTALLQWRNKLLLIQARVQPFSMSFYLSRTAGKPTKDCTRSQSNLFRQVLSLQMEMSSLRENIEQKQNSSSQEPPQTFEKEAGS